jgi:4-hydroxy-tetrahydrodipicolinate synthase
MRYRSDPASIRGSIAPLVTPFAEDGSLDLESVGRLVNWQLGEGSHGISVGGSTGEPGAQTVEERIAVMEAAAVAVDDRAPFLPGTGTARLDETLRLTAEAERLGADAALVITPYYSRPSQQGLYEWYSAVAAEFPAMPIVVYNVPIRTAVDIAPETVGRLRRAHDNVVGIKETTKDFEHVSHVLNECGSDFLAYSGIELLELAFVETNPVPVKWVMERLGLLTSAHARPPLSALSDASRERVLELLSQSEHVPAEAAAG